MHKKNLEKKWPREKKNTLLMQLFKLKVLTFAANRRAANRFCADKTKECQQEIVSTLE